MERDQGHERGKQGLLPMCNAGWFYKLLWPLRGFTQFLPGKQQPLDQLELMARDLTFLLGGETAHRQVCGWTSTEAACVSYMSTTSTAQTSYIVGTRM
jgi:hypothetical protein